MEQQESSLQALFEEVVPSRSISIAEDPRLPEDEGQNLVSMNNERSQRADGEDDDEQMSHEKAPNASGQSSHLVRSKHALTIFVCYAFLAVFTWICTCIMVYRPLTAQRYGYGDKNAVYGSVRAAPPWRFVENEHLYTAPRFLQSVVAVLTIPTTSAICAQGAVIFMQRNRHNAGLTLRQTMVLADKG